ncbi:CBS-domain-containing protein [Dacryopinax primogenitus]|uniref:CBS-domain-containing protein n=1 Tax=Dacryopinax primogenitus (strain DJM 731) TaxID=1858805 RepID=M5FX21_DACPD|nr:CBS-domain-containing protein [Dacryopinax primogenitus]EJU00974.1 CBS-domain-containing protein [Dacryopinax primogenitus]
MSRIPIPTHHPASPGRSTSPFPAFPSAPSPPPRERTMSTISTPTSSVADTRRKQSKRDEAIRRKIEGELARKRTISLAGTKKKTVKNDGRKGTVAALKPSPALTVPESITVSDASQLCAAKRTDCVLVVDDDEGLSGIFTAKDLAFRVTAEGLDPRTTPVSTIMTRSPMVTRDTTSATDALQLMVSRGFRHLPVCNEDGNVVGLLDITKVFHEALDKVERGSSASQKLYSALEGVQSELGDNISANPQAAAMLAYVEALRDKTALPDLTSVMDARTRPAMVSPKTTVREAAKLMKESRTTSVCVMENTGATSPPKIVGIFTSKDVVLRVIAAGLEPNRCSVVRVMTPHPDVAPPTMTIHDALKKMYTGHYLNLPVVEEDGRLVAIVDVLKLTYATLEQMTAMSAQTDGEEQHTGPMWGKFFDSIAHDDNESVMSGSNIQGEPTSPGLPRSPPLVSNMHRSITISEVYPHDSASVVDDDQPTQNGAASAMMPADAHVEDGTYVFKFRTPSGRTHRFQARHDGYENLRDIVSRKLALDPFFLRKTSTSDDEQLTMPNHEDFTIMYMDSEGDSVTISADNDVADAVREARSSKQDRVLLIIQGGHGWESSSAEGEKEAKAQAQAAMEVVKELQKPDVELMPVVPTPGLGITEDKVFGIPRDLLLPASVGALAIAIIGVFIVSRMTK